MMRFVHLNYHCHRDISDPAVVIEKHKFSSGFIDYIKTKVNFVSVKHMNFKGSLKNDGIDYHFFRSRNHSWFIPFSTHWFIQKQKPDIIFTEGFVFPLQILFLRLFLGRKPLIIAQHHSDIPFRGIRKWIQKVADKCIDAYVFTSKSNALPWLKAGIIKEEEKCHEVLSASSGMKQLDKKACRKQLGLNDQSRIFLWVARLIPGKDPLTVLKAFEKFATCNPEVRLHMIYQTDELLSELEEFINRSKVLQSVVVLEGKKSLQELEIWYNAADFYISGSHREGSGYALVEAMNCGCIPVVTSIPSFLKITDSGSLGFLFTPGDEEALYKQLEITMQTETDHLTREIVNYSRHHLSFEAISSQILDVCGKLRK